MGNQKEFDALIRTLMPFGEDQTPPDSQPYYVLENPSGQAGSPAEKTPSYEKADFNYWYDFAMSYEQFKWDNSLPLHPKVKSYPSYAGITKPMFLAYEKQFGTMSEEYIDTWWGIQPIDESIVRDFYTKMYWDTYNLAQLPKKTTLLLFDWLMNSPGTISIKKIQDQLGLNPDGHIGPVTISALQKKADDKDFLQTFLQSRIEFLKARKNKNDLPGLLDRMLALKAYLNGMSLEEVKKNKNKFYPPRPQGEKRPQRPPKKSKVKSPKTSSCKLCTFYASADLYGLGPGVYPPDHGPDYPFHPNCHCELEPVAESEIPADPGDAEFDPTGGEEYLKSLSEADRQELLGKDGAAAFEKDPSSWQSRLQGYSEPTLQQCSIPAEILFGPDGEG